MAKIAARNRHRAPRLLRVRIGDALERLSFFLLLIVIAWLPLPFGSNLNWAESILATMAFSLLTLSALAHGLSSGRRLDHLDGGFLLVMAMWLLWLIWIYLQTLPWPLALVEHLAPHRAGLELAVFEFLGREAPTQLAPSLDIARGQQSFLLSASYLALFLVAAAGLHQRRRIRWLLWVIVTCGLVQAMYGSLMTLSGLEFGAWGAKEAYRGFATGTFVNRNHFAGYLEISLSAAVALIVARPFEKISAPNWRQRMRAWLGRLQDSRFLARVAVAIIFVGLILSQSRMGNVAAAGALCLTALIILIARPGKTPGAALILIMGILIIDVGLFGYWFGLEDLAQRYTAVETDSATRLDILRDVRVMIPEYGLVGSGLGSFALAYPEFRSSGVLGFVDHAHNDYAQFLIETGVVGVSLLAVIMIATLVRSVQIVARGKSRSARSMAVATLMSILALAMHSVTDFNLQIPANAATLMILLAGPWAVRNMGQRAQRRARGRGKSDHNPGTQCAPGMARVDRTSRART